MAIEHDTITDPEIHEPKGASTAVSGTQYVSDGVGGGSWIVPEPKGVSAATVGEVYVANGAGSGNWENRSDVHGEMVIVNNTNPVAVIAATDTTLNTTTDYQRISSNWATGHLGGGVTFNIDELVVPVDGDYEVNLWASFEVAVTNTLVGVKHVINGTTFSPRKILSKAKTTSDINNISGIGYAPGLQAGDTISIWIAADTTTNIIGREAGMTLKLLHET